MNLSKIERSSNINQLHASATFVRSRSLPLSLSRLLFEKKKTKRKQRTYYNARNSNEQDKKKFEL